MVRKAVLAVAVLLVLAGCSGAGGDDGGVGLGNGEAADAPEAQAAGDDGSGGAGGGDGGDDAGGGGDAGGGDGGAGSEQEFAANAGDDGPNAAAGVDRALIKTGSVTIEVENYTTAEATVRARAAAYGGYVSGSNVERHRAGNETWRTGYVEVRVPSSNFSAMFEATQSQGTVLAADSSTKDVTDKLVDLNARLENLRAERDQLRTLYENANTTEELLKVQERLSDVQGEIERLEARKRSLRDQVAFSTIRVELREPRPERDRGPEPTPFHEQSPVTVFLDSARGFVTFGQTVFIAGVAALPWVLGLGVPALAVVGVGRRLGVWRRLPLVGRRSAGRRSAGRSDESGEADSGLSSVFDRDESTEAGSEESTPDDGPDGDGSDSATDPDAGEEGSDEK